MPEIYTSGEAMHYKNGRIAHNGDKILMSYYGQNVIGVLYDAIASYDNCNGRIAAISPTDPCPNLNECLHLDDVCKVLAGDVPDTSTTLASVPVTQ